MMTPPVAWFLGVRSVITAQSCWVPGSNRARMAAHVTTGHKRCSGINAAVLDLIVPRAHSILGFGGSRLTSANPSELPKGWDSTYQAAQPARRLKQASCRLMWPFAVGRAGLGSRGVRPHCLHGDQGLECGLRISPNNERYHKSS